MSADISPLLVHTPAAARPLWLRLRRSSPFTLTVLMCCLALLWVSPFIWMLTTSFSATTFGDDMASLLPRLPLTLDNFRDAWNSAASSSSFGMARNALRIRNTPNAEVK